MALLGVVCFALRPILIKLSYGYGVDPVTLIALRMIFSLPFFLVAAAWVGRDRERAPISRRDAWSILALGFTGYYLASFADFLGLQYISAGLGRLILFMYPTMVVLLSIVFFRRRPTVAQWLALAVTYAGVALVMWQSAAGSQENLPLGAALVFASAAAYSVYLVAGTQVIHRVGSVRFTAYAMTAASGFCIAQFLLLRPLSALVLPAEVYWLTIAMAVLSTVVPVFVVAEALRRIGANQVAIYGALGPVTTIFFGYLGLDETMTALQIVGTLLVLAGVSIVTIKPMR